MLKYVLYYYVIMLDWTVSSQEFLNRVPIVPFFMPKGSLLDIQTLESGREWRVRCYDVNSKNCHNTTQQNTTNQPGPYTLTENGPSHTGVVTDVFSVEAKLPTTFHITNSWTTISGKQCLLMYHLKPPRKSMSSLSIPFISKNSFVAILAIAEEVTIDMILVRKGNRVEHKPHPKYNNPFSRGPYKRMIIKPYTAYLFVLKDFPGLASSTAIYISGNAPMMIFTGIENDVGNCENGFDIIPLRMPGFGERSFLIYPNDKEGNANVTLSVSSSHPNNRIMIIEKSKRKTYNLIDRGDTQTYVFNNEDPITIVGIKNTLIILQLKQTRLYTKIEQAIGFEVFNTYIEFKAPKVFTYIAKNIVLITLARQPEIDRDFEFNSQVRSRMRLKTQQIKGYSEKYYHHKIDVEDALGKNPHPNHTISIKSNKWPFVAFFQWDNESNTFSLDNIQAREKDECFVSTSMVVVNDGIDNDCDGSIDEENHETLIDDDNDGFVREDTGLKVPTRGKCETWGEWACEQGYCSGESGQTPSGEWTRNRYCSKMYSVFYSDEIGGQWSTRKELTHCDPYNECRNYCDLTHWGPGCVKTCPENCFQKNCDDVKGTCLKGCIPGFSGPKCHKPCAKHTYGGDCRFDCKEHCSTGECHSKTGECEGGEGNCLLLPYICVFVYLFLLLPAFALAIHATYFYGRNDIWRVPRLPIFLYMKDGDGTQHHSSENDSLTWGTSSVRTTNISSSGKTGERSDRSKGTVQFSADNANPGTRNRPKRKKMA